MASIHPQEVALETLSAEPTSDLDETKVAARSAILLTEHRSELNCRVDRFFGKLLIAQWLFAIGLAIWISPLVWSGTTSATHLHVWVAIFLGAAAISLPVALTRLAPGSAATRHAIGCGQMLIGIVLIHVTGGRIETHFHVFGSLAVLAFYRDYRVLLTASGVVTLDHLLRGFLWPESVYGVGSISILRALEHTAWVVFEDVFLIASCLQGQREMQQIADRHARLELKTAREVDLIAARETSRAKSEFLANMSHEIRTPMSAVIGYADLLLEPGIVEAERHDYVRTIRRNGKHLLRLINDILDLSKIEAGKMTVESLSCSPAQIVTDIASLMRVRAQGNGLEFEVTYTGAIPEAIQTDPTRLHQILMNLVGNAIKFTSAGSIRVGVRCVALDTPQPLLEIEVRDTGIGMSTEELARLFQPFTQADPSTTRRFGGSGLGLAISRHLAGLLGGEIRVESEAGRGSAFILVLPVKNADGVRMLSGLSESSFTELSAMQDVRAPMLSGAMSVLLADDGVDNQRIVATRLKRLGAEVTIAENGQLAVTEAMRALDEGRPYHLILMDMQMPELDGYQATALLRERGYTWPIVALTAHAMAGDRELCIAAGCDDYLSKPIARDALVEVVQRYAPRTNADAKLISSIADEPGMSEVLDEFISGLPTRVKQLRDALAAGDRSTLQRLAHQLKGAGGGYGFPQITTAAAALEQALASGKAPAIDGGVSALAALCMRARAS